MRAQGECAVCCNVIGSAILAEIDNALQYDEDTEPKDYADVMDREREAAELDMLEGGDT